MNGGKAWNRCVLAAVALCGLGAFVAAHVRLIHPSNGKSLRWGRPQEISIVVSSTGSDDIHDGSHLTALSNAIAAWNAVTGVTSRMSENTSSTQRARTDWESDSIHLVIFDEDDESGYFPSGTGIVALTPVWFSNNGGITDADILFNGQDFSFTTSGESGHYDVQDVATHELGHFLGLDHSGWAGATMYPYVDPTVVLHRSLSEDEIHGLRDAYPANAFAEISGIVKRGTDETVVAGAHVVARDSSGRTRAGALASNIGAFRLAGLDAGTYQLYATPLDSPVSSGNLTSGHTVATDFESTVLGTFSVTNGEALAVGIQHVEPNVTLALGRNSDTFPLRGVAGQTRSYSLRGTGLNAGSTLTASDPSLNVTPTGWFGTQVNFQVGVPGGSPTGHVDLTVTNNAGERSILAAAMEITPRDPALSSISPAIGSQDGGTVLTLSGSRFLAGCRVVLGPEVYVDGRPDCTVVDANTITLTTRATSAGPYDVVVIDASGIETRLAAGFEFAAIPVVEHVFPIAGAATGGTQLVISGSDFLSGCVVTIDGVAQGSVSRDSSNTLRVTTNAYVPGGPYQLEVTNPGGQSATSAFAYVAEDDPVIMAIDPPNGTGSGGDVVLVHGANFLASTNVWFGSDAETGLGGAPAAAIELVDSATLRVTTPAHSGGVHNVMVRDDISGQASVLPAAFTYSSSGGGGGGCASLSFQPPSGPERMRDVFAGLVWILLPLGAIVARTHRLRRASARAS